MIYRTLSSGASIVDRRRVRNCRGATSVRPTDRPTEQHARRLRARLANTPTDYISHGGAGVRANCLGSAGGRTTVPKKRLAKRRRRGGAYELSPCKKRPAARRLMRLTRNMRASRDLYRRRSVPRRPTSRARGFSFKARDCLLASLRGYFDRASTSCVLPPTRENPNRARVPIYTPIVQFLSRCLFFMCESVGKSQMITSISKQP